MNVVLAYKNSILEFAHPIFVLVFMLYDSNGQALKYDDYRQSLIKAFNGLENSLLEKVFPLNIRQDVQYALVAYVDESIMYSNWNGRKQWMKETLQVKYFNEHVAGEGFYDRLEKICLNSQTHTELIELYCICLELGFKGKYRLYHVDELEQIKRDMLKLIHEVRGHSDIKCFHHYGSSVKNQKRWINRISIKQILFVTIVIMLVGFLGFITVEYISAGQTIMSVRAHKQIIQDKLYAPRH